MIPQERELVCGTHSVVFFGSESEDPRSVEYPSVRYEVGTWPEGWDLSDDIRVSPDERPVAVCPECRTKLGRIRSCRL